MKLKRFVLPLGISAAGSAGFMCLLTWLSISTSGKMRSYPAAYPISITGGLLCLAIAVGLLYWYLLRQKGMWTWKAIALDAGAVLIAFFPFLLLWNWVVALLAQQA